MLNLGALRTCTLYAVCAVDVYSVRCERMYCVLAIYRTHPLRCCAYGCVLHCFSFALFCLCAECVMPDLAWSAIGRVWPVECQNWTRCAWLSSTALSASKLGQFVVPSLTLSEWKCDCVVQCGCTGAGVCRCVRVLDAWHSAPYPHLPCVPQTSTPHA